MCFGVWRAGSRRRWRWRWFGWDVFLLLLLGAWAFESVRRISFKLVGKWCRASAPLDGRIVSIYSVLFGIAPSSSGPLNRPLSPRLPLPLSILFLLAGHLFLKPLVAMLCRQLVKHPRLEITQYQELVRTLLLVEISQKVHLSSLLRCSPIRAVGTGLAEGLVGAPGPPFPRHGTSPRLRFFLLYEYAEAGFPRRLPDYAIQWPGCARRV